jgi:hypothetical protein
VNALKKKEFERADKKKIDLQANEPSGASDSGGKNMEKRKHGEDASGGKHDDKSNKA